MTDLKIRNGPTVLNKTDLGLILKVFHNYEIINFLVNKIASKLDFFSCEKIKHSRKTCFGFEEYSFSDIKILLKINF